MIHKATCSSQKTYRSMHSVHDIINYLVCKCYIVLMYARARVCVCVYVCVRARVCVGVFL